MRQIVSDSVRREKMLNEVYLIMTGSKSPEERGVQEGEQAKSIRSSAEEMSGQDCAEELSGGDDPEVELEDVGALVVGPPAAVSNPRRPSLR